MDIGVLLQQYAPAGALVAAATAGLLAGAGLIFFRRKPGWRLIPLALLAGYVFVVLAETLFSRPPIFFDAVELNPLASIRRAQNARQSLAVIEIRNMFLNALMFLPVGALVHLVSKKALVLKTMAVSVAFSLTIEIAQLLTSRGVFSTEDIILNAGGALLGCLVVKVARGVRKHETG